MATPSSSDSLVITSGPLSGQTLPLQRREIVVGRDPGCDLPLPSYTRLSRRHARLTPTATGWKVEDLNSTNGVFIDGARVQEGEISHGTRLQLGDFEALIRAYTPASEPRHAPLMPPTVPDSGSGSPIIAPAPRKNPRWLLPALGLTIVLLGAGWFFGGRSSKTTSTDTSTQAKVRRALDTPDSQKSSADTQDSGSDTSDSGNTQTSPNPDSPATTSSDTDTATQPTVALPAASLAPPVNGRIAPATIAAAKSATVLIMRPENNSLSFGSGFVVGNGHQVITNRHVVAEDDAIGDCILIFDAGTPNERKGKVPASSITLASGTDRFSSDLALLTLPDNVAAPAPLPLGRSEDLNETDTTWVFGFPLGVGTLTLDQELPSVSVKAASVERVQRGPVDGTEAAKVLQLGSTVTHGNSGGPVLNANGEVVGVISLGSEGTGISYAIPTVWVKRLLP